MGFFDSLKGVGRALGGILETGIQVFGPSLAQVGFRALESKLGVSQPSFNITPRAALPLAPLRRPAPPIAQMAAPVSPISFPGGGTQPMAAFPVSRGAFTGATQAGLFPLLPGLQQFFGGGDQVAAGTFFRPGMTVARPVPLILQVNPATGRPTFWRHVGVPILFSGDLTACNRVARIAKRARRSTGRRRPR